jgi:hypothetical protein
VQALCKKTLKFLSVVLCVSGAITILNAMVPTDQSDQSKLESPQELARTYAASYFNIFLDGLDKTTPLQSAYHLGARLRQNFLHKCPQALHAKIQASFQALIKDFLYLPLSNHKAQEALKRINLHKLQIFITEEALTLGQSIRCTTPQFSKQLSSNLQALLKCAGSIKVFTIETNLFSLGYLLPNLLEGVFTNNNPNNPQTYIFKAYAYKNFLDALIGYYKTAKQASSHQRYNEQLDEQLAEIFSLDDIKLDEPIRMRNTVLGYLFNAITLADSDKTFYTD